VNAGSAMVAGSLSVGFFNPLDTLRVRHQLRLNQKSVWQFVRNYTISLLWSISLHAPTYDRESAQPQRR
jgi:hypothetical protein